MNCQPGFLLKLTFLPPPLLSLFFPFFFLFFPFSSFPVMVLPGQIWTPIWDGLIFKFCSGLEKPFICDFPPAPGDVLLPPAARGALRGAPAGTGSRLHAGNSPCAPARARTAACNVLFCWIQNDFVKKKERKVVPNLTFLIIKAGVLLPSCCYGLSILSRAMISCIHVCSPGRQRCCVPTWP